MGGGRRGGVTSPRWTSSGKRGRTDKTVRSLASFGELGGWAARYLEHLEAKHYSPATVEGLVKRLREFCVWCEERGLGRPVEITRPILEQYQRTLFYQRRPSGRALGVATQHGYLVAVALFFRYLARQHVVLFNPGADLELPRLPHRLPRQVLTAADMEAVLSLPNVSEPTGLRDRAILETLYSTGMRRQELTSLGIYDIDYTRRTVMIRLGKGKKDRIVPIGACAVGWVERYRREARPLLVHGPASETLFLSSYGEALSTGYLTHTVRKYIDDARLGKRGSCHLIRHTCATLMLENGADIRYVQALLGHAQLKTTEIYTHVAITKLREVHEATHPASMPGRENMRALEETTAPPTREELFTFLAAEAEDDPEEAEPR
jgi:integrase/recombinase XerD